MTDKQEDYYSMLTVLNSLLIKFVTVVAEIPAFKRALEKFSPLLERIKQVDSERGSITSGKTDVKGNIRNNLIASVTQTAAALSTYADEHDKPEILNRVDKTNSYYNRLRDTNLIIEATALVNLTKGIETELEDHGLKSEDIANLTSLAASYEESIKEVGTSSGEGKSATASVYSLIGEAKYLVEHQFDKHVEKYKTKNRDFYDKYWDARKVVETGVRHNKKGTTPATETTAKEPVA